MQLLQVLMGLALLWKLLVDLAIRLQQQLLLGVHLQAFQCRLPIDQLCKLQGSLHTLTLLASTIPALAGGRDMSQAHKIRCSHAVQAVRWQISALLQSAWEMCICHSPGRHPLYFG